MMERRSTRSADPQRAVSMYLETLCAKQGLKAVALATQDGTLVAGAGEGDVEYMGTVGASSHRKQLSFDGEVLHVRRLEVNGVTMCLTMAGADRPDAAEAICRILKN
jgi:hypothetical protein